MCGDSSPVRIPPRGFRPGASKRRYPMKKRTSRPMPAWLCWALGIAAIPAVTLVVLTLQKGSVAATLEHLSANPVLYALNLWPIAATLALAFCLFRNVFYSISVTTLLWGFLSYVNLIMVNSRGDPFVPGDILLLTEGIEAVGSYQLDLQLGKLALLLGLCLVLLLLGIRFKTPKPRWFLRLGGGVLVAGAFVLTMVFFYPDQKLYEGLQGPSRTNVPAVFDAFGFPYCFLHNFNLYPVDKPEGFDAQTAAGYEDAYRLEQSAPEEAPNIIMIMCEAFTDLPNLDAFTYGEEDNPIAAYNRLAADPGTVSGHLIVSNTGAGTANTEFDVLTGMMTNKLSPATSSAFRVVHRNTDSIPRMLTQAGYRTFFMHPGQSWFYNRESVYSYLGITDQVFREAFTREDYLGDWISDAAFLRVLEESLEARQGDSPLFTYAVTIQNHQAYTYGKYGFTPEPPATELALSDAATQYLSVYFKGLKDSAEMLEELTKFLNRQEEPYLLVFFGDHQPNLGGGFLAYQELGLHYSNPTTTEETLAAYEVPFLIWANGAYSGDLPAQAAAIGLSDGDMISSHYLGALTCQLAGFQGFDGYFDYLNDLRLQLPVYSVYGCRLTDGTWTDAIPQALQPLEDVRWNWQYYRLRVQKE